MILLLTSLHPRVFLFLCCLQFGQCCLESMLTKPKMTRSICCSSTPELELVVASNALVRTLSTLGISFETFRYFRSLLVLPPAWFLVAPEVSCLPRRLLLVCYSPTCSETWLGLPRYACLFNSTIFHSIGLIVVPRALLMLPRYVDPWAFLVLPRYAYPWAFLVLPRYADPWAFLA